MKAYIEVSDMINAMFQFLNSENYSKMVESVNGDTKEDGFRGAMFTLPAVMLHYCNVVYIKDDKNGN